MRDTVRRLLELGIDAATPVDLAIAIRASNWLFAVGALFAVIGAVGSLLDARSPILAVACLVAALVSAGCLVLSAAGAVTAARWTFLVSAAIHVVNINVALGRASGAPFFFLTLLGYPIICFADSERRQLLGAYALLLVVCVAADSATRWYGPLVLQPADAGTAYYIHLGQSAALAIFGLGYYRRAMVAARVELDEARRRLADVIENTLPSPIASRLQHGEHLIADAHSEASILFMDLSGFSTVTTRIAPTHLIELLNGLFSRLDEAADRHGVEKIKTIGDCYMAATGVLDQRRGGAVLDGIIEFAIAALAIVDEVSGEMGFELQARVGIATGPVVSGVIGTRRFTFDVWGETVNLASQMENKGLTGRIHVAEPTYWRFRDRYDFEPRGAMEVKGGRSIPTYLLIGRRGASASMGR